ncbi:MAG: hypothetical protein IRY99_06080 [Isosphaeraceae bacterium]|nr:hypothetical protein [Isosphaeraceae bacterium]
MDMARPAWLRPALMGLAVAAVVVALVTFEVIRTAPVRGAVRCYHELLAAANRPGGPDLDAARRLCSRRYLATHPLAPAAAGGLVGVPRNLHKNFQAWRQGPHVWLCPTNRVGPVYQFLYEEGRWRFDGPVGLLRPGGRVEPWEESAWGNGP